MRTPTAAVPLLTAVALLGAATPAAAAETPAPERVAWFNAASGGDLAAPQPTTAEGDLRVARAAQTQAFSTLLYRGEGVRASLDLVVREGSAAGTPDVVACPTVGTDWEAGANQPMDAAPEVDCTLSTSYGVLSEDGAALSFGLDEVFQVEPGTWSIALVPTPGGIDPGPPPTVPLPFTVDLEAPAAGAFVLEEEFVLPTLPGPTAPAPSDSDASSGFVAGADLGAPALDSGSAPLATAPLDPSVATPPVPAGPAPQAATPLTYARPVATEQAAGLSDMSSAHRLLALLVLAGGSAAVGYAAGQSRPAPRLLGGRARVTPPAAVPALAEERPRGIGRFARTRDAAPRRLR